MTYRGGNREESTSGVARCVSDIGQTRVVWEKNTKIGKHVERPSRNTVTKPSRNQDLTKQPD